MGGGREGARDTVRMRQGATTRWLVSPSRSGMASLSLPSVYQGLLAPTLMRHAQRHRPQALRSLPPPSALNSSGTSSVTSKTRTHASVPCCVCPRDGALRSRVVKPVRLSLARAQLTLGFRASKASVCQPLDLAKQRGPGRKDCLRLTSLHPSLPPRQGRLCLWGVHQGALD